MQSIMLDLPMNLKIIVTIAFLVSSVGGIITTLRQQTSHRCITRNQLRWHWQSHCPAWPPNCFAAVESSGATTTDIDCIARQRIGLVHYQGIGSTLGRREVLGSPMFPGSSGRLRHSGGRTFLMVLPSSPEHSKASQPQGDSARNGNNAVDGRAFFRPPSLKINAWHLLGKPVASKTESISKAPKAPSASATGTPGANATTNATIAELNAENPRNRTTALSHTTSTARTQGPLPVSDGVIKTKATKGTTQGSTETRVPRKKKLRLPPREENARVRRPLVVRDNMDLADVTSLVQEVLERVSETERELRRLRREGSLPETRSSVRERKFVIDTRAKMLGAAFAGCFAGMIVGWSVLPNLWLVGGVAGAISCATLSRTTGTIGSLCATCGIQVALLYKDVRDWWEQTVFLYKTGKLSYIYWKSFDRYDQAWGLTEKYDGVVQKISTEAAELDRQYKIRAKAIRAGTRLTKFTKKMGWSAAKEATQLASAATGWGGNQLRRWGFAVGRSSGDIDAESLKVRFPPWKWPGAGDAGFLKRPLGVSFDLGGIFGEERYSLYSAPAGGGTRKPGYRGEPVIPARIRHLFMTPKEIRDERLRKYRVGFMGRRIPRRWDKDD